jgi:hypothetical protein
VRTEGAPRYHLASTGKPVALKKLYRATRTGLISQNAISSVEIQATFCGGHLGWLSSSGRSLSGERPNRVLTWDTIFSCKNYTALSGKESDYLTVN